MPAALVLLMSLRKLYLTSGVAEGIGSAIAVCGGLVTMWALATSLDKSDFGSAMVAISLVQAIGLALGSWFALPVVFRVSRLSADSREGLTIGNTAFALAAATSALIAGLSYSALWAISRGTPLGGWADWLASSFVLVPMVCCRRVLTQWLQARMNVIRSTFLELVLPPVCLAVATCIAALLCEGVSAVKAALWVGFTLPTLAAIAVTRLTPVVSRRVWSGWDISYGGKIAVAQLIATPTRTLDVAVAGALSGPSGAADFAIASRAASLLNLGKVAIDRLLVPRIGRLLATANWVKLKQEYQLSLLVGVSWALTGIISTLWVAPAVLEWLGPYSEAVSVLFLLCIAYLARTGVGPTGHLLDMTGHAGSRLALTAAEVALFLVVSLLLAESLGPIGVAIGYAVAVSLQNALACALLKSRQDLSLLSLENGTFVFAEVGLIGMVVIWPEGRYVASAFLVLFLCARLIRLRALWFTMADD